MTENPNLAYVEFRLRETVPVVGPARDDISLTYHGIEVVLEAVEGQWASALVARTTREVSDEVWQFLLARDRAVRSEASGGAKQREQPAPDLSHAAAGLAVVHLSEAEIGLTTNNPAVASFLDETEAELRSAAMRPLRAVRWRFNLLFPATANHRSGLRVSLDGDLWIDRGFRLSPFEDPWLQEGDEAEGGEFTVEGVVEFANIVESGAAEPLAREIFLEAVRLHEPNPRAAFTLAVVAAEVGLKQFAATQSSSVSEGWLLMEGPSPPLSKLTRRYLPFLTDRRTRDGKIAPPELLKALDDANERRNKIVHRGEPPPTPDEVVAALGSVNDFLYMLDWFSGQDWAFGRMREEVQAAWREDEKA